MVRLFSTNDKKELIEIFAKEGEDIFSYYQNDRWIHLIAPTEEEILKTCKLTEIEEPLVKSILDEEEAAHIDDDNNVNIIVIDVPYIEHGKYLTVPFGILYNENHIISVSLYDVTLINSMFAKMINKYMKTFSVNKKGRLALQLIYRNTTNYISVLRQIDKSTSVVESNLNRSMKNKELLELLDLGKSLVYISTSLNSNLILIEKINKSPAFSRFEEDKELIEDIIIEAKQAIEMCSIYRDILNGKMDAYASIISNNVNTVMKALAVVTIIVSIPTIMASFWGMNFEELPLQNNVYGFWIILAISLVLVILGGYFLIRMTGKVNRKK